MITLNGFVDKLIELQKTINNIGVVGVTNAANVVKAYDICECMINGLHDTIVEIQNQNGKVGEGNGGLISDSEST
jgi:hypothetical protein